MLRATWLAMLCCLHASALASPRSDPTQGRAAFTGASSPNPTAIEINPAALGLGPEVNELYVAASGVWNRLSIARRTLDIDTGVLADGPDINANLLSPGGMLAFIWHSGGGGRITLGVALHSSPAERFIENEDALRYHTLGGSHRTYAGTIAGSIRASNRFFVGVSVSLRPTFLRLRYARDTALEAGRDPARGIASDCGGAPCGIEDPLATELYDVDARSGWVALDNVVGTVGIAVRIARNTWLGLAYHTPPGLALKNELNGTMSVTRAPRDGGTTLHGAASVYLSQPATFDAELRSRLLPELDLVVGARLEDLSRMQAYDVRGYGSAFPRADIPEWQLRPRGFRDVVEPFSIAAWAGVDQIERETPLIFSGRIGVETSSLPEERTSPLTIAPASLTLDAGLQYRLTRRIEVMQVILQASYGLQYFPGVDVTDSAFDPRARLACEDTGFDYSTPACAAVRNGYAIATAAGEYSRIEQAARIALRLTW